MNQHDYVNEGAATKPRSATAQLLVQLSRRVGDDEEEDGKEVRIVEVNLINLYFSTPRRDGTSENSLTYFSFLALKIL